MPGPIDVNDPVAVQTRLQQAIDYFSTTRSIVDGPVQARFDVWISNAKAALDSGNLRTMQQFVEDGRFAGPSHQAFVNSLEAGVDNVVDVAARAYTTTAKVPVVQQAAPVVEEITETVESSPGFWNGVGNALRNLGSAGANVIRSSVQAVVNSGRSLWDTIRGSASSLVTMISTALGLTPAGLARRVIIAGAVAAVAALGAWWWSSSGETQQPEKPPAVIQPANPNEPAPGNPNGPGPGGPGGPGEPVLPPGDSGGGSPGEPGGEPGAPGNQPAEPGGGPGVQSPGQPGGQSPGEPGGQHPGAPGCCGGDMGPGGGTGGTGGGGTGGGTGGNGAGGGSGSGSSFGHTNDMPGCC